MKHVVAGIFLVDMGGVHITRHDGEEIDVLHAQLTHKTRAITNVDFIKSPVFNHVHRNTLRFLTEPLLPPSCCWAVTSPAHTSTAPAAAVQMHIYITCIYLRYLVTVANPSHCLLMLSRGHHEEL